MKISVISPSYKLLLENSAEQNNTQFRKESKAQKFNFVVSFIKKKKSKSETSLKKYLQLCQNSHYSNLKSKTLSRKEQSRTIKPSALNSEPNIFTD